MAPHERQTVALVLRWLDRFARQRPDAAVHGDYHAAVGMLRHMAEIDEGVRAERAAAEAAVAARYRHPREEV